MRCAATILVVLVAQLLARPVLAQADPVVRVELEPSSVRVGEALSLRVTVLVPTYFPRPPVYPDFEVANAITRLPPDSSYPTSERVDGESWSGIVREYRIYPLAAASYRMEGATIRVTYANPGADPVVRDVPVPALAFEGTVPAGARNLDPYLAGTALELSLDVDGDDGELAVGDAVVLTYRAALQGLPSLFLPALSEGVADVAGNDAVTVYSDAPRFGDDEGIATRTERLTLVFTSGGDFTVPAVVIDYWNTAEETLRTARTAPLLFTVTGPPSAASITDRGSETSRRWPFALLIGALLLALGNLLRKGQPAIRDRLRRWQGSEAYAFRRLRRELTAQRSQEVYRCVQRWLEQLEPGLGPRAFANAYGDGALSADIEALSDHVFGSRRGKVELRGLEDRLVDARKRYLGRRGAQDATRLAPLNP